MSEHTKEPWHVGAQNDGLYIVAGDPPTKSNDYPMHNADRTLVAAMKCDTYDNNQANARRIVACVNACALISTGYLEGYASLGFKDGDPQWPDLINRYIEQRDKLLAEMQSVILSLKSARSAIWDADNLASYSEKLLLAINRVDGAKERVDVAQDSPEKQLFAEKELREAEEFRSEYWNAVKSMVYEYSKRAQRFKDSLDTSIHSSFSKADAPLDIPDFLRNQSNLAAEKAKAACQCKVTNLDGLCVECGMKVAE